MEGFIGNRIIIEGLTRACERGSAPHALLFSGPKGVGKSTAARAFAARLLGVSDVFSGSTVHPDACLLEAGDEGKSITIAQARALRSFLSQTPLSSQRKVVVIDGVEDFTQEAANALLKTLEEPPADVVLFLITHDLSRVLPTIRSRAIAVRFAAVPDGELAEGLRAAGFPARAVKETISFAEGRPGFAMRLLRDEAFFQQSRQARERAERIVSRDRLSQLVFLAKLEREDPAALRALPSEWLRFGRQTLAIRAADGKPVALIAFLHACFAADNLLRTTNVQPSLALTNLLFTSSGIE